jgi:GTP-binding protein
VLFSGVVMNLNNIKLAISAVNKNQFLYTGLKEIVFVGRSNVGKSSLINKIINRRNFARTSSVPGKTATINYYELDKKVYLVDLPGYGYARVSKEEKQKWGQFIDDYFKLSQNIALIILLIDIRHDPTKDDIIMVNYMKQTGLKYLIAATKADKIAASKISSSVDNIKNILNLNEDIKVKPFSASNDMGRDKIVDIIQSYDPESIINS